MAKVDPDTVKGSQFRFRLNAFGDATDVQSVGYPYYAGNNRSTRRGLIDAANEAHVQFKYVRFKLR